MYPKTNRLPVVGGMIFGNVALLRGKNDSEENRFGITVSKKVGNSVVRHRVTRLIRESIRLNLEQFEKGFDIVIVARNTAKERSYFDVESALLHLGRLHKIVMR